MMTDKKDLVEQAYELFASGEVEDASHTLDQAISLAEEAGRQA